MVKQLISSLFPSFFLPAKEEEKRFVDSFDKVAIGMAYVDLNGKFIKVNKRLCRLLGYSHEEFHLLNFKDLSLPEDLPESAEWIKGALAGEITYSFYKIKRYRHKQGHLVWAKLTTTLIRDKYNQPDYFLSSIQDVTELKEIEAALDDSLAKLKHAYHELELVSQQDGLTGALNIKAFKEKLTVSLNAFLRYQTPATLLFIDIDDFKNINDQYGHLTGDNALTTIVKHIQTIIRSTDYVGRYGGDEFAILLTNINEQQATEFCHRLGHCIEVSTDNTPAIRVNFSVGICQLSDGDTTIDSWIANADKAMYSCKKSHKC